MTKIKCVCVVPNLEFSYKEIDLTKITQNTLKEIELELIEDQIDMEQEIKFGKINIKTYRIFLKCTDCYYMLITTHDPYFVDKNINVANLYDHISKVLNVNYFITSIRDPCTFFKNELNMFNIDVCYVIKIDMHWNFLSCTIEDFIYNYNNTSSKSHNYKIKKSESNSEIYYLDSE
jgi:hypothetical protein